MTVSLLEREFPNDHLPLLRWLMFTGVSAFGFILAWYYGLFHLMLASDKTYISAIIGVLYILATVHCFVRTAVISREMDNAQRVFSLVSRGVPDLRVVAGDVVTVDGTRLPPGQITAHIRNLILKATLQRRHRLDQTLPELLEKTRARGWKAVVRTAEPDRVEHLDGWLWAYRDDSFLPHAPAAEPGAGEPRPARATPAAPGRAQPIKFAMRCMANLMGSSAARAA